MHVEAENRGHTRPVLILSCLALAIYFAVSASGGLNAYFTQDDGGNLLHMHNYWENSLGSVLASAVRVVTPVYRPLGGIYYFVLYRFAGFNPLPFRIVCLLLMLANLLLAFSVLRRLSGSLAAAFIGAMLIANHPAVLWLLYSSGTIYEILCFLFYFLAVRVYFLWRQAGQLAGSATLSWRHSAALLALTGCALDSKEMAMTLPAALFFIELIYFPPECWSWRAIGGFVVRQGRVPLLTAALVLPTIAVKVLTRNPLSNDPAYAAHSLRTAIEGMRAYHTFLLYGDIYGEPISTGQMLALWAAMALLAIILRSRAMQFGLVFLIVSFLPVCLIGRRAGYMAYIPLMGWALYAGSLFQRLGEATIRWARLGPRAAVAARFAGVAGLSVLIVTLHASQFAGVVLDARREQGDMRRMIEELRKVHPKLHRGASLLLLDDPLPASYQLLFLARLAYADPTLTVDRVKMLQSPPGREALTHYDHILAGGWNLHDAHDDSEAIPLFAVGFDPARVHPREGFAVEMPRLARQTLDVAVDIIAGGRADRFIMRNWCTLDAAGRAALVTPELPPETIRIRWLRAGDGEWVPASGQLEIGP
jgi:hypothetical protein